MHLYVHVPFCARRCSYCDFAIAVRRNVPTDEFVRAVLTEWDVRQSDHIWGVSPSVDTIYLGGGTPSRLEPGGIARLIDQVARDRNIARDAEITLEANPEDVTPSAAAIWRAAGVNRVSLGVQSFNAGVLAWMHRTHTVSQVARAVETLRSAGIEELSLDLIFGVPSSLERDWAHDLECALRLGPRHLSLYGLTVEDRTPLARWVAGGRAAPVDESRYATEFLAAHATLLAWGFEHYEVSNAALPGSRARHNSAYWGRAPYLGLGPSAHSADGDTRRWNVRHWAAYQSRVAGGVDVCDGVEVVSPEAAALERLYLGLRTAEGVSSASVPEGDRARWTEAGWAREAAGRLALTPEGWLRLDALVAAVR